MCLRGEIVAGEQTIVIGGNLNSSEFTFEYERRRQVAEHNLHDMTQKVSYRYKALVCEKADR